MQAQEDARQPKELAPSAQPPNSPPQLVRLATPEETGALAFPQSGYVGVAAKFADVYSSHYESPKEFFYLDLLTLIGSVVSGRVRADFAVPCQPRLYALKISPSAWRRKSTSTRFADNFLQTVLKRLPPDQLDHYSSLALYGVGSAEGLAVHLEPRTVDIGGLEFRRSTRRALLVFDEFRRFEAKAGIEGSALRPMVNELFDSNRYDNLTKTTALRIEDGHLGFLSNTTEENYRNLVGAREFLDIGFLNRFFLVVSDTRKRVSRPKAPAESDLKPILQELSKYLAALPLLNPDGSASEEVVIPLTAEAEGMWDEWYCGLEETPETARLDNLGMRVMGLLAFTSGRKEIGAELLGSVLEILEYQRRVRSIYRPIVADNACARMEQKIRHALERYGHLKERDLRRYTNADRDGLAIFNKAVSALCQHGDVKLDPKTMVYELAKR